MTVLLLNSICIGRLKKFIAIVGISLNLRGTKPMITGFQPEIAAKRIKRDFRLLL
jgi:hypothetical protein